MKKYLLSVALILASMGVGAQEVRVAEPEFINSYCILTSDSTLEVLPKESGTVGKHQNKVSKWSKFVGGAADIAGAAGMVGIGTGSLSDMATGARVMTTASGVANAAETVNGLASSVGLDIIFKGGHSMYTMNIPEENIRLLIKAESNETDPMDCYRIVRFKASKKERRIQWLEWEPSLLGSKDAEKNGYVNFTGHKYGEQSYLLTIPANEIQESGEYGIVFMSIATATTVPVGTFSVRKRN